MELSNKPFRAKVQVERPPEAQVLIDIYEGTFGSTGPGCCPEALAAVLDHLGEACRTPSNLTYLAKRLRGE